MSESGRIEGLILEEEEEEEEGWEEPEQLINARNVEGRATAEARNWKTGFSQFFCSFGISRIFSKRDFTCVSNLALFSRKQFIQQHLDAFLLPDIWLLWCRISLVYGRGRISDQIKYYKVVLAFERYFLL